ASDRFGYPSRTAAVVSQAYGGIFDRSTLTIALNWSSGGRDRMGAAIEHELTHLMIRDLTQGRDVPVWVDEGIATLVERGAPNSAIWSFDDGLTGRALAASGTIGLAQLTSVGDFHSMYARVGRPLYAFCADAV